jgi:hypothetical protein
MHECRHRPLNSSLNSLHRLRLHSCLSRSDFYDILSWFMVPPLMCFLVMSRARVPACACYHPPFPPGLPPSRVPNQTPSIMSASEEGITRHDLLMSRQRWISYTVSTYAFGEYQLCAKMGGGEYSRFWFRHVHRHGCDDPSLPLPAWQALGEQPPGVLLHDRHGCVNDGLVLYQCTGDRSVRH